MDHQFALFSGFPTWAGDVPLARMGLQLADSSWLSFSSFIIMQLIIRISLHVYLSVSLYYLYISLCIFLVLCLQRTRLIHQRTKGTSVESQSRTISTTSQRWAPCRIKEFHSLCEIDSDSPVPLTLKTTV